MLADCRIPQRGEITPQPEARRSSSHSTYPMLITILSIRCMVWRGNLVRATSSLREVPLRELHAIAVSNMTAR
jgi:hypothetical protein